jgi:hypothetical protein
MHKIFFINGQALDLITFFPVNYCLEMAFGSYCANLVFTFYYFVLSATVGKSRFQGTLNSAKRSLKKFDEHFPLVLS